MEKVSNAKDGLKIIVPKEISPNETVVANVEIPDSENIIKELEENPFDTDFEDVEM